MRIISFGMLAFALTGCGKVERGVCSTGRNECDQACVDLQNDSENCGMCGHACDLSERCVQGACAVWCPAGFTVCDSQCYDLRSDASRCGACDHACSANQACVNGQCSALACPAGLTECGGGCVDTRISDEHCGGCNMPCSGGAICMSAMCVAPPACAAGCAPGQLCVNGSCVCPTGQAMCGGTCADRQTDTNNCGTCGHVCAAGQECVSGACVATCRAQLNVASLDDWGLYWDGLDRIADNYAGANTTCASIGGRLPLVTELWRDGVAQTGRFQPQNTSVYLWTADYYDPTTGTVIIAKFNDSIPNNTSNTAVGTTRPFRCVCPPPPPKNFTGNACYGTPGVGCFTIGNLGKHINIDLLDRAPLTKGAAEFECLQAHARVADSITLMEAIRAGLPNGGGSPNGPWVHTGDDARPDDDTAVKWNGIDTAWAVSGNTTVVGYSEYRPFRCAGINYDSGPHPNAVTNEFLGGQLNDKGETMDNSSASWSSAHDICYGRGGHLPRSSELATLVMQGLPNGSQTYLWSSDEASFDGSQFNAVGVIWQMDGSKFRYLSASTDGMQWNQKSDAGHLFRCIYYPIDQTYAGPADSDCNGGCFKLALSGTVAPTMWFDSNDRGAAPLETAIDTCRKAGGHLASERDFTEAIRHGLPNGSGNFLSTWDIGQGASTGAGTDFMIVRWTATETGYADQYTTDMTNAALSNATFGFRCMWTNELRY